MEYDVSLMFKVAAKINLRNWSSCSGEGSSKEMQQEKSNAQGRNGLIKSTSF